MRVSKHIWRLLILCMLVACSFGVVQAQKRKRHRAKVASQPAAEAIASPTGVQLKLADGSVLFVDDASESAQGIWYQRDGISHLMPRERVKAIQRAAKPEPVVESTINSAPSVQNSGDGPAWIYFKGGAKVEVDTVAESPAGVWYQRSSLSVFVERDRVDHIDREAESLAQSDSSNKKDRGWTTGNARIDGLVRQNGARFGVDPYLIFCVMEQESHFNARALSPKGAQGLMQLMPGTSARFGVRRPSDPAQNIAGGTRYLRQLIEKFNGRVDLVLASYNAGEGAVMKFGGRVPPYRETRDYVKRISYRYRRNKAVALTSPTLPKINTAGN